MKLFFFFIFLIISLNLIYAVPEFPMIVSGNAYINEKPAETGTEITALVNGNRIANSKVNNKGKFNLLLQKLNEGDIVKFYVDNIDTMKNVTYKSGDFKQLTLKAEKSYFVYYFGVVLILLIGMIFFIWKRKLIKLKKWKQKKK